jgi:hypothetical protein
VLLRSGQNLSALNDGGAILQLLLGSQIGLMNVAHGCLEHTSQMFRGGRSLRFHVVFCNPAIIAV